MIQAADILRVFQQYRGDAIVIPGRSGRHWVNISEKPNRDLPLGDPAMGGHASFAMGLALAMPEEKVVLFDSEGDILMNLGVLPTIAEKEPKNFYHFLLDNEVYGTTGGQPVPNAKKIKYEVIAEGSGYPHTYSFDNLEEFANNIEEILNTPGPVFVTMKIVPEVENTPIGSRVRWRTRSQTKAIEDLQEEFGIGTE
jgi:thiamine pyrophosphate-dependent acetolactate synthase large subunit-like protein